MKNHKILFGILAALASLTVLFGYFYQPDLTIFLSITGIFSLISLFRPQLGLYLILLLPVFGEFSRFTLLGRSLIASDIIIPLYILIWLIRHPVLQPDSSTRLQLKTLGIFIILAFFSLLFSLTALSATDVASGALYLIRLISYIALFPITFSLFREEKSQLKLLKYILLIALLIALGGFIQLQILPNLEELAKNQGYDPHINRLVGSWLDPNFIGGFFAFIISIFAGIAIYSKSSRFRAALLLILAILSTALFLTYSRSAYLALAASALVIGLLKSRRLLITLIILAAIGISVSERAQERVGELVTSITSVLFNTAENPDPTARLRLQNWDQTVELIKQKPLLGYGYNNLTAVKLQEGFIKDEDVHSASGSDSSLLTITATTGLLGLAVFLFSLFLFLKTSAQNWLHGQNDLKKGLGLGLLAGLLGLFVHSNFVNSLLFPQIMIFFWILLGLLYAKKLPALKTVRHSSPRPDLQTRKTTKN
jgi:O-antigen ligase